MQKFLEELPTLIVTIAVLAMVTLLLLFLHNLSISDIVAIVSPVIAFWFLRSAFSWQAVPPQSPPLVLAQPPLTTQSIEEAMATPEGAGPAPGTYIGVHPNPSAKDIRAAISEQTANNVTTSTPQS